MAKQFTKDDDALLAELGIDAEVKQAASYTPREERVIAGFEEILRFVEEQGRVPRHGEDNDIFERLYAVRLDRIRHLTEFHELLRKFDTAGLLDSANEIQDDSPSDEASDDELLEALGVESGGRNGITALKHVRPTEDRKSPDEVAQRVRCDDFEAFRPVFEQVQRDLSAGVRETSRYQENATINRGDLFIVEGQKALVADMDEEFRTEYERKNRRLRVIYDNGTESNLLLRSLQRALYKDENGRRILASDSDVPALFAGDQFEGDLESGHIYVLRSLSEHPFIAKNRDVIHKIGVTGGDIKKRIAKAKKDPTFLLADVELVESYRLANIDRTRLEGVIHQFFADAQMDLELQDRFGERVEPREWFLVPLPAIHKLVEILKDGRFENCKYDTDSASIIDTRTSRPIKRYTSPLVRPSNCPSL